MPIELTSLLTLANAGSFGFGSLLSVIILKVLGSRQKNTENAQKNVENYWNDIKVRCAKIEQENDALKKAYYSDASAFKDQIRDLKDRLSVAEHLIMALETQLSDIKVQPWFPPGERLKYQ